MINTRTKIKFNLAQVISTTTVTNLIVENIQNSEHLQTTDRNSPFDKFNFYDIFLISSDDELNQLENKLETNEQFRSNLVCFQFFFFYYY